MTHDELLAKIESFNKVTTEGMERRALRAVVELTKPSDYDSTDAIYWKQLIFQAIEKELS